MKDAPPGLSDMVRVTPDGALGVFPHEGALPREIALINPSTARPTARYSPATASAVRRFFAGEESAASTPLVPLTELSQQLGIGSLFVKDESMRFGTKAFKVAGATWAMVTELAGRLGIEVSAVTGGLAQLKELWATRFPATRITFVTCTDGNHGQAVAWAARRLGQRAIVYMPRGSAASRVARVREQGGECSVTELNYDETVNFAAERARGNEWVLLQDTTLPGYTEVPSLIMEGYLMMMDESMVQLAERRVEAPTHLILQAGVGSMAAACVSYFVERARSVAVAHVPTTIIVEPRNAACMHASAERRDGLPAIVDGDLETMIAGLACGVPSELAWPVLKEHVSGGFCWIDDVLAFNGMRRLAEVGVEAGECGGAAVGLLERIMAADCALAAEVRRRAGLGPSSCVLVVNTEGATDPENYAKQCSMPQATSQVGKFGFAPPLAQEPLPSAL
mmetsp:Transcript_51211/g.109455  ORF Transcript_51211/g.109455 Transcript_51211/m.109455 type:complete len:452 (-) Transcript_51211:163-1518(-)